MSIKINWAARSFVLGPVLLACANLAIAQPSGAIDLDNDNIDDSLEASLIARYAPILYQHENFPDNDRDDFPIPSSMARMLRHSQIRNGSGNVILDRGSLQSALTLVRQQQSSTFNTRTTSVRWWWGYSDLPEWDRSWRSASLLNEGIFARVWRPYDGVASYYSVQYYVYFTHSDTDYTNLGAGGFADDAGSHEGDWICLDLGVEIPASGMPQLVHAIMHNHGRQHFVTTEALELEGGRPVVYLESQVHELWPNAGSDRSSGWPRRTGFATNRNFDVQPLDIDPTGWWFEGDEQDVCRRHEGLGVRWDSGRGNIPNLGELTDNVPRPVDSGEAEFVLRYRGRYGDASLNDYAESPKGPPYNAKMWKREWNKNTFDQHLGPWTTAIGIPSSSRVDPYGFPVQACDASVPIWQRNFNFCLWMPSAFSAARQLSGDGRVTYVAVLGSVGSPTGSVQFPYGSITEAVSRIQPGARLQIEGRSAETIIISKPMLLTRGGTNPVTIGR